MTQTDVETGLPALPEDQRWAVSHPVKRSGNSYGRWSHPYLDKSRLVVKIESRSVASRVVKRRPLLFGGNKREREEQWFTFDQEKCLGTAPIAVLNAARKIMQRQAKLAAVRSLVGVYPPKKLEVMEESK